MADRKIDRVWEQTTGTGTGALQLNGVYPKGYRPFSSVMTDGQTIKVTIVGQDTGVWETQRARWSTGGVLTRLQWLSGPTGATVEWGSETKDVFSGPIAAYTMTGDAAQFWAAAVTMASASTMAIGAAEANVINVTGTTTINAFDTPPVAPDAAHYSTLIFADTLTLTHNATSLVLPTESNITTGPGDSALVVHVGSGNWRCLFYERADGTALSPSPATPNIRRIDRSTNIALVVANIGQLIVATAGFTQTFAAAATLGVWSCEYLNDSDAEVILDPNGSETIDGETSFRMYPGEMRRINCDGTELKSVVMRPFSKTFLAGATFHTPPGYRGLGIYCRGAGGGGGSGQRAASSTSKAGGNAGGGGGCGWVFIPLDGVEDTVTVTVGAGGVGGTAVTTDDTVGHDGTNGGASSFGSHVTATGGVKGKRGNYAGGDLSGAAGGSGFGLPPADYLANGIGFEGAGGSGNASTGGLSASFGGGGSMSSVSVVSGATGDGGASAAGGGAGGAGGGEDNSNVLAQPGDGGCRTGNVGTLGGGGGLGGTSHATAPTAGFDGVNPGDGGGGGGANQGGAGAAGGDGIDGGGGGGGGASRNGSASGPGGNGGDGSVTVWGI